jgi:predicted Zn-dependent protease
MRAAISMGLDDIESAEQDVEAVLAIQPDHPGALCGAGRVQLGRGDAAGALENLRRASDFSPEDALIRYWTGRAAWQAGTLDEAQAHLEEALRLDRGSARNCLALGDLYLETGAIDDAIMAYEQAVLAAPEAAEPRIRLGRALTQAALTDRAVTQYQKASELSPRDPEPWLALSRAWMASERPDRAVEAISAAIQRRPEDASLYMEAGRAYRELRELDQASEMFRRAMHLSPRSGKAYAQYAAVSARHFVEKAMPSDFENVDEEVLR